MDEGTILVPLYILSDLPPPLPKVNVQYIHYRQCVAVLSCVVDHILQEFNTPFSDLSP